MLPVLMYCLMALLRARTASSFSSDTGVIGGSASSASRSRRNVLDLLEYLDLDEERGMSIAASTEAAGSGEADL